MIFGFGGKKNNNRTIVERQYALLTQAARQPAFYTNFNVPDTVMGRFEMLSVMLILYFRRTAQENASRSCQEIAQEIVDAFFEDLDHSIRELGIGDPSVPKRMKKLAGMFYGRLESYAKALDEKDAQSLGAALKRNFHPGEAAGLSMDRLADYMLAQEAALLDVTQDAIERGDLPMQSAAIFWRKIEMAKALGEAVSFSYPVKVGHVSANPLEVTLSADERERRALAKSWDVLGVDELSAVLSIHRWKKDAIRIRGRVTGRVSQACVVTLEPVEAMIDQEIDQIFVPEGSKLMRRPANDQAEMVLDPEGPDLPEVFEGDTIDAGCVVAEFAALALDPYPRKPGVKFKPHIESAEEDTKPSPFAALKDWKRD